MPGMFSQTVNKALTNIQNSAATPAGFADYVLQQHSFSVKRALLAQAAILNPAAPQVALVTSYQTCVTAALAAEVG